MKCTKCETEITADNLMFDFVEVSDGEKLDIGFECPNKSCRAYHYTFLSANDFVAEE